MRDVNLNRQFEVIAIPDSIIYRGTRKEFTNNNFAYTDETENIHVTVLENDHIVSESTYEATMIHLIPQAGELKIHHEVHTLGLFFYEEWLGIFKIVNLHAWEQVWFIQVKGFFPTHTKADEIGQMHENFVTIQTVKRLASQYITIQETKNLKHYAKSPMTKAGRMTIQIILPAFVLCYLLKSGIWSPEEPIPY